MCWVSILAAVSSWGCAPDRYNPTRQPAKPLSPEDEALRRKFRGVSGGEKIISATERLSRVYLYDEDGGYFGGGVFGRQGSYSSYGGGADRLPMPKTLRYVRFDEGAEYLGGRYTYKGLPSFSSTPLVDVTVPVAQRIPEDLLDDLRRDPKGGLRLKIRLLPDAILIGWDIERRPGFNAQKSREGQHYPAAYSHTGGDFKESRIAHYIESHTSCRECIAAVLSYRRNPSVIYNDDPNGFTTLPEGPEFGGRLPKALMDKGYYLTPQYDVMSPSRLKEKGWYIHPRTGQRIETDF